MIKQSFHFTALCLRHTFTSSSESGGSLHPCRVDQAVGIMDIKKDVSLGP